MLEANLGVDPVQHGEDRDGSLLEGEDALALREEGDQGEQQGPRRRHAPFQQREQLSPDRCVLVVKKSKQIIRDTQIRTQLKLRSDLASNKSGGERDVRLHHGLLVGFSHVHSLEAVLNIFIHADLEIKIFQLSQAASTKKSAFQSS